MKTNHPLIRERQILVIIKKPGQPPMVEPLFPNELKAFQEAVGGYIEALVLSDDLLLMVNKDCLLLKLPYNVTVWGAPLVGTVLAVGTDGQEFASIKSHLVPTVLRLLGGGEGE